MAATVIGFFLNTALGRFLGKVLLALFLFVAGYAAGELHRYMVDHSAEQIAALKAQLHAAQFDAATNDALRLKVQGQLDALQSEHSGLARQVSDYEDHASKLEDAARACRVATDDDLKRLRNIR